MSKKSERKAARVDELKRKSCLLHFLALSVIFESAWLHGINGGGSDKNAKYAAVNVDTRTAKFVREQWGKIVKWRYAFVQTLGGTDSWERGSRGFYRDAEQKLRAGEDATKAAWPDGTREDYLVLQTYLLATAIHDWIALNDDHRRPLRYFSQTLMTFADRLLPADSPLVEPLNTAYFATRDIWQANPDWTDGGTLTWTPSAQELYQREPAA